jgi:nucleoside-diphosphate kinase
VERTLFIIKPDAVERGLIGEIVRRLETKGLRLLAAELRQVSLEVAELHYEEHRGKPFFAGLLEFITASPSFVAVVEGPADTYAVVRSLMGATDPKKAAPGTIRGDLGTEMPANLVHGSDSPEAAAREIGIFFPELL